MKKYLSELRPGEKFKFINGQRYYIFIAEEFDPDEYATLYIYRSYSGTFSTEYNKLVITH